MDTVQRVPRQYRRLNPPPDSAVDKVLDTSGAGDAFNGAYLATRLRGGSAEEEAQSGLMVASRVVTHAGAIVPRSISHPRDSG